MLLQRILFPRPDQVAVSVAAVQRDFPKAVIERCEIGPFRNRSFAATVLSVSHAGQGRNRSRGIGACGYRCAMAQAVWIL